MFMAPQQHNECNKSTIIFLTFTLTIYNSILIKIEYMLKLYSNIIDFNLTILFKCDYIRNDKNTVISKD